jgi:hypothetical protein
VGHILEAQQFHLPCVAQTLTDYLDVELVTVLGHLGHRWAFFKQDPSAEY